MKHHQPLINQKLNLLFILCIGLPLVTIAQTRLDDSLSLVDLYTTTNGPGWTVIWDLTQPMDNWSGVTVDYNQAGGRVTCLDLDGDPGCNYSDGYNNLIGTIPDLNLTELSWLDLSHNKLTGSIPNFSKMPKLLWLYLNNNELSNTIPDFSGIPDLFSLLLQNNQLTGTIPDFSNLPDLYNLDLNHNQLSGPIPDFSSIPDLEYLLLVDNSLINTIPDFSNLPKLRSLKLKENQLTGTIPDFSNLPNLITLELDRNQLVGSFPNFSNIPNVEWLNLSFNQLTGSVPDFDNLPNLVTLGLSNNQLSGTIPDFSNLPQLGLLYLDSNKLTGNIPDFSNLPKLAKLFLEDNELTGPVPDFSKFKDLIQVIIRSNQLSGTIPDFNNMPELLEVFLGNNLFSGQMPGFSNLPKLEKVLLNNNKFTGGISNFSNVPNLKSLNINNNLLTDTIPNFSNFLNLQYLVISYNQLTFSDILTSKSLLDSLCASNSGYYQYAPQDTIPILLNNSQLYVNAGGTLANNTYNWFKDNVLVTSISGDSLFLPTEYGRYRCEISNSLLPGLTLYTKSKFIDPAYPGDANNNGKVEASDVLYCGISYNQTGLSRVNASTSWTPQPTNDWIGNASGINNKFQDCDGNGLINDSDLAVIKQNFDSISPVYQGPIPLPSLAEYYIDAIPLKDTIINRNGNTYLRRTFDLILKNINGFLQLTAKGVSGSFRHSNFNLGDTIYVDLNNSSFGDPNDLRKVEHLNPVAGTLDFAVFTIMQDQQINGPVLRIIIEDILVGLHSPDTCIINQVNILKEDSIQPVIGQRILLTTISSAFTNGDIQPVITITPADCNNLGRANAYVTAPGDYNFKWSTDDTTSTITELAPGGYSITVNNNNPNIEDAIVNFKFKTSGFCLNKMSLFPKVFLEGPLNQSSMMMNDYLRTQNLIPLQAPYGTFDSISNGVLTTTGPTAIVDWVEVELRSTVAPYQVINRKAGLLRRNGEIVASDGVSPVQMVPIGADSVYVVVRHRNHLPVLFGPVTPDTTMIDCTLQNGPIIGFGVNQRLVNGKWVAYAGDVDVDKVISATDRSVIWNSRNQAGYLSADINLDGVCDGVDRSIIWNNRNTTSQLR